MKLKQHKTFLLSLLLLITIGLFSFGFYVINISYYGPLEIRVQGYSSDEFRIQAKTPLHNELSFFHNDSAWYYPYQRFYAQLKIVILNAHSENANIIISGYAGQSKQVSRKVVENERIEVDLKGIQDYNFIDKVTDVFKFIIKHHLTTIGLLALVAIGFGIALLLVKLKNKILNLLIWLNENKYKTYLVFVVILISGASLMMRGQIGNLVISGNSPDQIDYHTCAVNFSKGYGFLYGGKLNDSVDYKIALEDESAKLQHELLAGVKRLDRFPAYIIITAFLYKLFGVEPRVIYIFQWILLCLFVSLLPIAGLRLWGEKGFWGSFLAMPLLLIYLNKYALIISPDLISVFLNFYVLFLFSVARQNRAFKHYVMLSFLLGLSFLFKASLMFFAVLMWADIFINAIKKNKKMFLKLLGCFILFLICWLPYNMWRVVEARQIEKNAKQLFSLVNKKSDINAINNFLNENKNGFGYYPIVFEINNEDICVYQNIIVPELENKPYPDFKILTRLNVPQRILFFAKYQLRFSSCFFMTRLYHNGTSVLEVHNEFVTDGQIHPEWMHNQNSYYNNDGLFSRPPVIRALMFYINNPRYIFLLPHYKLKFYLSENFVVLYLILLIGLLQFFNLKNDFRKRKNALDNLYLIGKALILLIIMLGTIFFKQFTYLYLILSVFIVAGSYAYYMNRGVKYMIISLLIFPVMTYGNSKYLIFFDTILFIIFGVLLIEFIKMVFRTFSFISLNK